MTNSKAIKKSRVFGISEEMDDLLILYSSKEGVSLPTPFELTGDSAWDVGGELYELYDLELDMDDDLLSDDFECDDGLSSIVESQPTVNIMNSNNSDEGVKVLRTKSNQEVTELVRESTRKQSLKGFDPNDAETMKFFEEIGAVLKP